jgi:hypothetical protein
MKYPDDFKLFDGKRLSSAEINELIQQTVKMSKEVKLSDLTPFLAGSHMGDIKIEVEEYGHIIVWQQIASYWEEK